MKHRAGSIQYHGDTGRVEVKRAGYYFIYSQMYYYDDSTEQMGHFTYINREAVMASVQSVIAKHKKLNTKYHGGVFRLKANDNITIRVPYTKHYNMDPKGSFFGTFLLHPLSD